jgi:uncharacterized coiled-coil protein SlyX
MFDSDELQWEIEDLTKLNKVLVEKIEKLEQTIEEMAETIRDQNAEIYDQNSQIEELTEEVESLRYKEADKFYRDDYLKVKDLNEQ